MRLVGGPETSRNVLIDGNNLLHRAHYAFVDGRVRSGKTILCSPSGFPTGMTFGFLSILGSWLYSVPSPTSISVFFDGEPTRRLSLDPTYKSDRSAHGIKSSYSGQPIKMPNGMEAYGEIELIQHLLTMLGCKVYHHPNEEADDLIASFVSSNSEHVNIIYSSDKDFFQLVGHRTVIYRPGHDGFFDSERVTNYMNELYGVPVAPPQIRMFKSFTGDPSDSIPGILRIRKKVVHSLCSFPSVKEAYATGLPGFSKSEKEKAESMIDRVTLNFELVGLKYDLDFRSCLRPGSLDFVSAKDFCREELGMASLDLSGFRIGFKPSVVFPTNDWLSDI
jgi:5'-3' exonuclease